MTKQYLKVATDGTVDILDVTDATSYDALSGAVEGWVECIALSDTLDMWCNEEGKLTALAHNPFAQAMFDQAFGIGRDYIVGNVVFTGGADDEGNTLGLKNTQTVEIINTVNRIRRIIEGAVTVFSK